MSREEANLAIGSSNELIDNLLMLVHSNKTGLREGWQGRSAGSVTRLGPLWREKHGSDFFHQENKDADNAQDDGYPTHGDDDLSQPVEDAAPRNTG